MRDGERSRHRAKCLAALACGVALFVPASVEMSAYSWYAKWSTMPVVYYLNPANPTLSPAAVEAAVQRATSAWIGPNSSVDFIYGGGVNDTTISNDRPK